MTDTMSAAEVRASRQRLPVALETRLESAERAGLLVVRRLELLQRTVLRWDPDGGKGDSEAVADAMQYAKLLLLSLRDVGRKTVGEEQITDDPRAMD